MRARLIAFVVLLWCVVVVSPALAGEADLNGLWCGSLYGSDVQAKVEQENRNLRVEAVVHDLTGGTNVYHFFGVIERGHMVLVHVSGHRFEGDTHGSEIVGVLTTKGGSRLEVRAERMKPHTAGQGSMEHRQPTPSNRRPG